MITFSCKSVEVGQEHYLYYEPPNPNNISIRKNFQFSLFFPTFRSPADQRSTSGQSPKQLRFRVRNPYLAVNCLGDNQTSARQSNISPDKESARWPSLRYRLYNHFVWHRMPTCLASLIDRKELAKSKSQSSGLRPINLKALFISLRYQFQPILDSSQRNARKF